MTITTLVYETFIRADRETVWAAITEPEWTRQYFFGTGVTEPMHAGHAFLSILPDGEPAVDGAVEVFDPPSRLVQTWHVRYDEAMAAEPAGRVEWTLTEAGPGLTRLRVVHGDLAASPLTWANVRRGWYWVLDSLKSLVETGSGLPTPAPGALDAEPTIDRADGGSDTPMDPAKMPGEAVSPAVSGAGGGDRCRGRG
ncbi:MAG TPA: SRPBCC domain-containing protein [Dermatophilaceae bacterium]|nr:SRPBCC domain-containing protein [Dermatophilaceae bacterium]